MSDSADASANEASATDDAPNTRAATAVPAQKSMPAWFIGGIFGVLIGGVGGFLLAKYGYGHRVQVINTPVGAGENYGKPPMMDAALGRNAVDDASGKRDLTALVGKLELLSRPDLKLAIELDPEQQAKLAAELTAIRKLEALTEEDAQKRREAIEALLTPEQKATLDAILLPRRQGGAGGSPGAGAQMGAMPGGLPEDNPFAQDQANKQQLADLLGRLPASGEPAAVENEAKQAP